MSQAGSWALSLLQARLAPGRLWENNNRYPEPTLYHHSTHISHTYHIHTHTHIHKPVGLTLSTSPLGLALRSINHSLTSTPTTIAVCWCPFNSLQVTDSMTAQTCSPLRSRGPLSLAPEPSVAPYSRSRLPARGSSPQASNRRTSHGLATGGWNHKGVSTNNRKRVLPSSGSLRLTRGGDEGPGEGGADSAGLCPQAGVVGGHAAERQVVGSERQIPLLWQEAESRLEGESLTVRVLLASPAGTRKQGSRAPQRWQSKVQGSPLPAAGKPHTRPSLSFHSRAPRQDQGPGRAHGLQHGGEVPGSAWSPLGWGGGHW